MPLLFYGPGGGGGGAGGYAYSCGEVLDPSVKLDENENISISWGDPPDVEVDGNLLAKWKGTVVVCKEGSRPYSLEDGVWICESNAKNQFKDVPLVTDVGGRGHYYGIFPYTEEGIVNAAQKNVVSIPNELNAMSWSEIAEISEQGMADQYWEIGDEKTVNIESYGTVTLQIAGFGHDALTDGSGVAGVTFVTKELIGSVSGNSADVLLKTDGTGMLRQTAAGVKALLPLDLQNAIKQVNKKYNYADTVYPDYVFVPSAIEVGQTRYYGTAINVPVDGVKYPLFDSKSNAIKKELATGLVSGWWTRTRRYYSPYHRVAYVDTDGEAYEETFGGTHLLCVMFCV